MPRASHRLAGSYIDISSTLTAGELLDLAEKVAIQVFKRSADKPGPIVKTGRTDTTVDFAVVNVFKKAILRFRIWALPKGDGTTTVTSKITHFRTSQDAVFGIPAGPKKLVAWIDYETFMKGLQIIVENADRTARTSIITAEG